MLIGQKDTIASKLYATAIQTSDNQLKFNAALPTDGRGKPIVNEHFQTAIPKFCAAGNVIGFPAPASTSMEQGQVATGTNARLRAGSTANLAAGYMEIL
jgi:NAD(P) transhydrogenase